MPSINTTLFWNNYDSIYLIQIYVDYIIFGATNEHFYEEFSKMKQAVFEMSMVEELKFFLGL